MKIQQVPLSYRGNYIQGYRCGQGSDVILLIHGAGVDSAMLSWKEVMERLGKKTTVYAFDLPGYGNSDPMESIPEEGFYPYYHHTLEAVVDQLKLDRFVLVGLSMGGAIAIRYALEHPEHVCGLVPVSSWGLSQKAPYHSMTCWIVHHTDWIRRSCLKMAKSPALIRAMVQYSLFGRKNTVTEELVEELSQLLQKPSAMDSIDFYQKSSVSPQGAIPYFGDELSRLKMPVLLINGKRDPLVPRSHAEQATRIIPNSRLHVMPSCKHWCCKEQPELFCQALWTFVKRDCLFSYKNMLPHSPEETKMSPPFQKTEENLLHQNLKKRWEKRRRQNTRQRLTETAASGTKQRKQPTPIKARDKKRTA